MIETAPPTLVIVDDSPTIGRVIASYLARSAPEYATYRCTTGSEALDYLAHMPVVGVITDHTLPDIDGITLTGLIKSQWPSIPVILFTGGLTSGIRSAAQKAGCVAVLEKPNGLAALWPTLQTCLTPFKSNEMGR